MAKSVDLNSLNSTISNELKLYSKNIVEGIKDVIDDCTEEFVKDTKQDAPRGNRKKKKYYTHITSKTIVNTSNSKTNIWYVKDPEYRLTHLLKNGHATRNGGRTKAQDFITPNYEKMEQKLSKETEEVIANGY